MKDPRQYSLVKLEKEAKEWLEDNDHKDCPLLKEEAFVYLGEIPNMEGHCVVIGNSTKTILSGYHIDNFEEISPEET